MTDGRKVLVFGGTTEAREFLKLGLPSICCVATEYGAKLIEDIKSTEAIIGKLDHNGMASLIKERRAACVVDATHPYAKEVTANIRRACEIASVPLLRLLRDGTKPEGDVTEVDSCSEAAEILNGSDGNALLTVGSKELETFTSVKNYDKRLYVRVLPVSSVVRKCEELGFDAEHIIAFQGPFSTAMNEEMLRKANAECIVTKDGGSVGGTDLKLHAAKNLNVKVLLVRRPNESGADLNEAYRWAAERLNENNFQTEKLRDG